MLLQLQCSHGLLQKTVKPKASITSLDLPCAATVSIGRDLFFFLVFLLQFSAVRAAGGALGLKDSFILKAVPIESQGARAHPSRADRSVPIGAIAPGRTRFKSELGFESKSYSVDIQ